MSGDSKLEFLKGKAKNFQAYLTSFTPDDDVSQWLNTFNEGMLIPTILAMLVPMQKAGQIPDSVSQLVAKLQVPEDKRHEVQNKIERYLNMFVEVATF